MNNNSLLIKQSIPRENNTLLVLRYMARNCEEPAPWCPGTDSNRHGIATEGLYQTVRKPLDTMWMRIVHVAQERMNGRYQGVSIQVWIGLPEEGIHFFQDCGYSSACSADCQRAEGGKQIA